MVKTSIILELDQDRSNDLSKQLNADGVSLHLTKARWKKKK